VAWIESHTVILRHRKIRTLAKDLRLKPVYVMGHLHALWHAVLEQQEDGDLSSWDDDLISDLSAYQGDAPQYVSLLQKHGWLDGKLIHDWMDYAGRYLETKYRTSNPDYLKAIKKKHGLPRVGLESDCNRSLDSPPNQPNQPNQPTNQKQCGFKPPTLFEIKEYCKERKKGVDPYKFFNFYESKGWMVGKNKMKKWKAAVHTWEKESFFNEKSDGAPQELIEYEEVSDEEREELSKLISETAKKL